MPLSAQVLTCMLAHQRSLKQSSAPPAKVAPTCCTPNPGLLTPDTSFKTRTSCLLLCSTCSPPLTILRTNVPTQICHVSGLHESDSSQSSHVAQPSLLVFRKQRKVSNGLASLTQPYFTFPLIRLLLTTLNNCTSTTHSSRSTPFHA